MLIGFVGYRDLPPGQAPPPPDDPPGGSDDGSDANRKQQDQALRRSKSLYLSSRGSKAGKYAWAISLLIHGAVILGAVLAARYYYTRSAARPGSVEGAPSDFGGLVAGGDATDGVHYLSLAPGFLGGAESHMHDLSGISQNLPSVWFEPQTLSSLQDDITANAGVTISNEIGQSAGQPCFKSLRTGEPAPAAEPAATQPGTSPEIPGRIR